jgi:hypothetical protein
VGACGRGQLLTSPNGIWKAKSARKRLESHNLLEACLQAPNFFSLGPSFCSNSDLPIVSWAKGSSLHTRTFGGHSRSKVWHLYRYINLTCSVWCLSVATHLLKLSKTPINSFKTCLLSLLDVQGNGAIVNKTDRIPGFKTFHSSWFYLEGNGVSGWEKNA